MSDTASPRTSPSATDLDGKLLLAPGACMAVARWDGEAHVEPVALFDRAVSSALDEFAAIKQGAAAAD
jgi:hypothetical protein